MQFLRTLRDRIRRGEITCSVRLWQQCHVKVGGRYALPPGRIVVTNVSEISVGDITAELARESGFVGLVDLLKTAKHGPGRRVFLVEFRYEGQRKPRASAPKSSAVANRRVKKTERLEDLRTIGGVTAGWLRAVGIETPAALRRVGAARAYSMVVYHFGKAANRSLLWALASALEDRAYNSFTEQEKARLCREAGVAHHQ